MALRSEVIATLPFKPARSSAYVCYLNTGKVVVVEDGKPRFDTGVGVDEFSNDHVEGTRVVRTFDPVLAEKAARAEQARVARDQQTGSTEFKQIVRSLAKAIGAKSKATAWPSFYGGTMRVHLLARTKGMRVDEILELQRQQLPREVVVIGVAGSDDSMSELLVFAGTEPFDACDLLINLGNTSVEPADVKRVLGRLRKDAGLELFAVSSDRVRCRLSRVPKDLDTNARRVVRLRADYVSDLTATKMLRARELALWWD